MQEEVGKLQTDERTDAPVDVYVHLSSDRRDVDICTFISAQ
jgi:hypothetical protein